MKYKFSEEETDFLHSQGFDEDAISAAKIIIYTYPDWFSGSGIGPFWGTGGEIMAIQGNGILTIYVLPESVVARIKKERLRRYEMFTDEIFQVLKEWHLKKCAKSRLSKKKVNQLLLRKLRYENLHKATFCIYGEKPVIFSKEIQAKRGSLLKWYDEVIVNGNYGIDKELRVSASDMWESVFSLRHKDVFYACAVEAIFIFKVSIGYNPSLPSRRS